MNPDPLLQLRDIHLPQQSGLPFSFFIVALATMLAMVAAGLALAALRRRRRSVKSEALLLLHEASLLSDQESLVAQAKLLRRLVNTLRGGEAALLQGRAWLERLDSFFATDFFTSGGGQVFGEALYRRQAQSDAGAVAAQLRELIGRLKC